MHPHDQQILDQEVILKADIMAADCRGPCEHVPLHQAIDEGFQEGDRFRREVHVHSGKAGAFAAPSALSPGEQFDAFEKSVMDLVENPGLV